MKKKDIQVAVAIIFASVLSIFALTGGNTKRGEVRLIEDSIRNLRRVDNLQLSCSYTVSDKNETITNRIDVWANQLASSWVAEYYTTDIDGTRMYLKRFCDGKKIYTYVDWNGEWSSQPAGQQTEPPCFDSISTIAYTNEDIVDVEKERDEDTLKISYSLSPDYLSSLGEQSFAYLENYYQNAIDGTPYVDDKEESVQLVIQQSRQMRLEDTLIVYKIDENEILRSGNMSYIVYQPELVKEESGTMRLGNEMKIRNLISFEIKKMNQTSILDKIEQCESEIQ